MTLLLDGKDTDVLLNSMNSVNEPSLLFSSDNMEDGDHQLYGEIVSLQVNGSLAVDYFESVLSYTLHGPRNSLLTIYLF